LGVIIFYFFVCIYLFKNKKHFDVIHIHGDWSSLLFTNIIKRLTKAKVLVFSLHDQIGNKFTHKKLLPRLLKNVDIIFSTGYETAEEVEKICDQTVTVQPSGVNGLFFQNIQKYFNVEKKRVVTVANLFPKKNISMILEIAKEIPSVEFDIIGGGSQYEKLMTEIKQKKLNNVNLLGMKSAHEVYEAYQNADCFLLTSLAEGTPTSMMEAMVVGLPIVSSNAGGIEHIVKDGENGYVIKNMQKEEYTDKLTKILNNTALTKKMSQNNRELGKIFSWDHVAKRITTLTQEVLNAKQN